MVHGLEVLRPFGFNNGRIVKNSQNVPTLIANKDIEIVKKYLMIIYVTIAH